MLTVREFARAERSAFADLLDTLTAEQWAAPSLCRGWRVRDVAVHTVAYLGQSRLRLFAEMMRARGDVDRLNQRSLTQFACVDADRLTVLMRQGVDPAGAGALYGCRVALIECLVHQQDVRRPLGLARHIPAERLEAALPFAWWSPVIGGARRMRGIRAVATDLDWAAGGGPLLTGSAEALLLAMTGRVDAVIDDLDGPGLEHWMRDRS